jgi:hypothetical protein
VNGKEKAMKARLFGLASDPEKNGRRGDSSQERKKGCNGSLLEDQLTVLADQLIWLFLS